MLVFIIKMVVKSVNQTKGLCDLTIGLRLD